MIDANPPRPAPIRVPDETACREPADGRSLSVLVFCVGVSAGAWLAVLFSP